MSSAKPFIPEFRVYDKATGLLHRFNPIHDTDEDCLLAGMGHPLHCLNLSSDSVVITAHTGYYDRNGVPIFEGDIIRNTHHPYDLTVRHGPFGWYAGEEEGGIDITEGGFFSSHEDGTPRYERCGWLKDVEIVGNIWKT